MSRGPSGGVEGERMRNGATRTQRYVSVSVDIVAKLEAQRLVLEQRVAELLADVATLEVACAALRQAQARLQKKASLVQ